MKKLLAGAAVAATLALAFTANAATIYQTQSSDSLNTFRTNVNSSLVNLNAALGASTTTVNNWSALQVFKAGASTTQLSVFEKAYFGGTATSTFDNAGNLTVAGLASFGKASSTLLSVGNGSATTTLQGQATSTFGAGLQALLLNITGSASSTFANGINLLNGCLAYNGTCVGSGGGSGTVGSGTTGQTPYYAGSGTTLTATSSLFIDTTGFIGIGTTTPFKNLTVVGSTSNGIAAFIRNTGASTGGMLTTFNVGYHTTDTTIAATAGPDIEFYASTSSISTEFPVFGSKLGIVGAARTTDDRSGAISLIPYKNGAAGNQSVWIDANGYFNVGTTSAALAGFNFQNTGNIANVAHFSSNIGAPLFTIANTGKFSALNGSSTALSVFGKSYFGGSATTTIDASGNTAVAGTLSSAGNADLATSGGTVTLGSTAGLTGLVLYGQDGPPAHKVTITTNTISGDRTLTLPNATGTFCLTTSCAATTTANTWTGLQTFATASSTNFSALTAFYSPVTSAVLLADANKLVGAASTQTCTNQFVRALSAAYVATCAAVSLTADVSGILPIANGGSNASSYTLSNGLVAYDGTRLINFTGYTLTSALASLTNASTTNLTVGTSLQIPNSTSQAPTIAGYLAQDTTDNQIVFGKAGTTAVLDERRFLTFSYATTTAMTGTTTLQLGTAPAALIIKSAQCYTDAGTMNVQYKYGTGPTNVSSVFNASTTIGTVTFSGNNTPAAGNAIKVDIGTPASSPTQISCTLTATVTAT